MNTIFANGTAAIPAQHPSVPILGPPPPVPVQSPAGNVAHVQFQPPGLPAIPAPPLCDMCRWVNPGLLYSATGDPHAQIRRALENPAEKQALSSSPLNVVMACVDELQRVRM